MDFFNLLIVILGFGTAAFIAVVFLYAIGTGLVSAWMATTHGHHERG